MNLTSSGESYCFFPKYIYLCHLKSEQCRQVPNITDFQNFSFPSGSKPVLGESLYPSILILKLSFHLLYSSENSRLFFLILWDKKKKKSQKPKRERERCSQEISSVLKERCHAVIFLTSTRSISGQPAAQSCLGDFQSLRPFQLPLSFPYGFSPYTHNIATLPPHVIASFQNGRRRKKSNGGKVCVCV